MSTPENDQELAKGDSALLTSLLNVENNALHNRYFTAKDKLTDVYTYAPKLKSLIENIKRLDQIDLARGKGLYKHFIYSRLKNNKGIKLAESVFTIIKSEGYDVYTSNKDTKTLLKEFNERVDNPNAKPPTRDNRKGEEIRFIGLSVNHKEGLDLFDVKYAHIFEEPSTKTDLAQIIGRGTRWCGQSGLDFPWDLNVYIYRLLIPQSMRNIYRNGKVSLDYDYLSDLYNQYKVGHGDIIDRFTQYAHYMSVDFGLTQEYIKLKPIGNILLMPIRLESPAQYTTVSTFKPYTMNINDMKRYDEETKNVRDFLTNQQFLNDVNNAKKKDYSEPVVEEIPDNEDDIIRLALDLLRTGRGVSSSSSFQPVNTMVLKQIPKKGIIGNILSFVKSMDTGTYNNSSSIYKIIDKKDCTVMIGKAKQSNEKAILMTYPVIKGDNLYNFCFLKSELLELIDKDGLFTVDMMIEIQQNLNRRSITDISISKKMSEEFKSAVIASNDQFFTKTTVEKSLMTIVLDMMTGYLQYTSVDVNAGLFYKFLNFSRNTIVGLLKVPLQMMSFVLSHPTLSVVFMILLKITKVVLCIYTSGMEKAIIKHTIKSLTVSMGNSPLAVAFKTLLTSVAECASDSLKAMLTGGVGITAALTTCLGKFGFESFNLSTSAMWIMSTVVSTLKFTMKKLTTFDMSSLMVLQGIIVNPYPTVAKLVFGIEEVYGPLTEEQASKRNPYLETISFYMKGDLNMLTVAVVLQLLPYRFMKWIIAKLIDMTYSIKSLTSVNKMMVGLSEYIETVKGDVSTCLDLVIWILNTYVHYEIVWYIIREMKVLFMDVMPCLFAKIKGYFMRLYDASAKDEFVDCCTSDIRSAIELVMRDEFSKKQPTSPNNPPNNPLLDLAQSATPRPKPKGFFSSILNRVGLDDDDGKRIMTRSKTKKRDGTKQKRKRRSH